MLIAHIYIIHECLMTDDNFRSCAFAFSVYILDKKFWIFEIRERMHPLFMAMESLLGIQIPLILFY